MRLRTFAFLLSTPLLLPAQGQLPWFASKDRASLPDLSLSTLAVAAGDVDGDGDLDLVLGNRSPTSGGDQDRLLLNDGEAVFSDVTATHMPKDAHVTVALRLVDVDGDRDLDLVLAGSRDRLYRNDGKGKFTDVTTTALPPPASSPTTSIATGDVDKDGDNDLVLGKGQVSSNGFQTRLFLNDGKGKFSDATSGRLPARSENTMRVILQDFDGDGDADLYTANSGKGFFQIGGQDRLYVNNGKGTFVDAQGNLPVEAKSVLDAAAVDLDRDRDTDIVVANQLGTTHVWINDGKGRFSDATATRAPSIVLAAALGVGDYSGDGWPDLFLGRGDQNLLFVGDGKGNLRPASVVLPRDTDHVAAVASADLDRDGRLDLVTGATQSVFQAFSRNRLYLNTGQARFALLPRNELGPAGVMAEAMAAGDVDGDGDVDVMLGDWHLKNELYLGDGNGGFTPAPGALPQGRNATRALALADVDGDGDLDAYVANGDNVNMQDQLWLGDGKGGFTDVTTTQLPLNKDRAFCLAMGDVDGDKDLDVVVGLGQHNLTANKLYLNDGKGKFSELSGALPAIAGRTRSMVLVDIDGDLDSDLVWADYDANAILVNDGKGRFSDATAKRYPATVRFRTGAEVIAGDVDADGDQDLFYAAHAGRPNRLFLNDGKGFFSDFSAARLPAKGRWAVASAFGDVDEDGDLDILLGHEGAALYLNDGKGFFRDATSRVAVDRNVTHSLALVDVDQDGDLDAVLGRYMRVGFSFDRGRHRVLINHHRDWAARRFIHPGRSYPLRFTAEPGYGAALAIPYLNIAPLKPRVLVPGLGKFGLSPAGLVTLQILATGANGSATLNLAVPKLGSVKGLAIHTQALVVHTLAPGTWRLSNVQVDGFR